MRQLAHLARRFFGSLRARLPGPDDQAFVAAHLGAAEGELFWDQAVADQAHAVRVGHRVAAALPERVDLVRAALLHDVGKRHSASGTVARSVATVLAALRLPVTPNMRRYLDHAESGALDLAALGCEPQVVDFARYHHGNMPAGFTEDDWAVLVAADHE